ncbi:MAG TPA: NusA N-terminal domain-containing protein, partial [Asticcacaulis sp.]
MSFTGISANRQELLQIAEAVAREKAIDKSVVIASIEEAIQKAARSRYGADHDIRVHIDPRTGEMTITRVTTVVEDELLENEYAQKTLADALRDDK